MHLLPHLQQKAEELGIAIEGDETGEGVLILNVVAAPAGPAELRQLAFTLIGSVAEASTHVRELGGGEFEVVTGMLDGDGSFASHGHLLRLRFATSGTRG